MNIEFDQLFVNNKGSGRISLYLFLLVTICSCTKTYDCEQANLILTFNDKSIDSLSDFTIYKYQKSTSFGVLLDSIRIINGAGVYFESKNNTTKVFLQTVDHRIVGEFDWKVHMYSTTVINGLNEISISNIEEERETMKCKKKDFATAANGCQCMNTLKSYKLNGLTGIIGNKIEYADFVGYELVINP